MSEMLAFGIGCFNFGLKGKVQKITLKQYFEKIEKCIESIANATNIELNPGISSDEYFDIDDQFESISEGENYFPTSDGLWEINFNLFIPNRLQKTYYEFISDDATENFKIQIKPAFHHNISFIECVNGNSEADPSSAVVIVREFLKNQLAESSKEIRFEILGPSPFHGEFFLEELDGIEDLVEIDKGLYLKFVPSLAYNKYNFYYKKEFYPTIDEAKYALYERISSELSIFYSNVIQTNVLNEKWNLLDYGVVEIIERVHKFLGKIFINTKINDLAIELSEFDVDRIWGKGMFNETLESLKSSVSAIVFENEYNNMKNDKRDFPSKELREVIMFLQNRNDAIKGNIYLVLSALLGGAVGAVLTKIMSP